MSSKLIENIEQVTQSVEAVVELLKYLGRPTSPIPEAFHIMDMVLVLNSKKDAFYVTTLKACSCPSFIYRGRPCKHQKKYFAESKKRGQTIAETLREHDENLWKMPASYRRMVRMAREETEAEPLELIPKGSFRPVLSDEEV